MRYVTLHREHAQVDADPGDGLYDLKAMEELKAVRNFAPRESSVHFTMGKIAKKLGRLDEAMKYFTTALYFQPKDSNIIRSAIDKINEAELEDDDRL
jgi:anaphase-promoting complex subunit 3